MATDIYTFNPYAIQWIDVRNYTNGISWDNVKIISGLSSINFQKNTTLIKCEVVRHSYDKHLFYVRVGGSVVMENQQNLISTDSVGVSGVPQDIYYREFSGISSFRVEYTDSFYNSFGLHSGGMPRLYKVYTHTIQTRCWYRYKPMGTSIWSGWILRNSDTLNSGAIGQLHDIGVRIEAYNTITQESGIVEGNSALYPTTLKSNVLVNVYGSGNTVTSGGGIVTGKQIGRAHV